MSAGLELLLLAVDVKSATAILCATRGDMLSENSGVLSFG